MARWVAVAAAAPETLRGRPLHTVPTAGPGVDTRKESHVQGKVVHRRWLTDWETQPRPLGLAG